MPRYTGSLSSPLQPLIATLEGVWCVSLFEFKGCGFGCGQFCCTCPSWPHPQQTNLPQREPRCVSGLGTLGLGFMSSTTGCASAFFAPWDDAPFKRINSLRQRDMSPSRQLGRAFSCLLSSCASFASRTFGFVDWLAV